MLRILIHLSLALAVGAAATPAAIAQTTPAPKYSTARTTIGVLMGNPATKAIVTKAIPEFAGAGDQAGPGRSGNFERASGMTLPELKAAVGAYAPDLITDARLAQIDAELAKLDDPAVPPATN